MLDPYLQNPAELQYIVNWIHYFFLLIFLAGIVVCATVVQWQGSRFPVLRVSAKWYDSLGR
jgi:hypothetical protein